MYKYGRHELKQILSNFSEKAKFEIRSKGPWCGNARTIDSRNHYHDAASVPHWRTGGCHPAPSWIEL